MDRPRNCPTAPLPEAALNEALDELSRRFPEHGMVLFVVRPCGCGQYASTIDRHDATKHVRRWLTIQAQKN